MQSSKQFGIWPLFMMITLSVGLVNHVVIVPLLLDTAKRDAWLCVLVAVPAVMLWALFPLMRIIRSVHDKPINEWLGQRMPSAAKWVILLPIVLLLLFTAYHSLVDAVSFSNSTYIPLTPSFIVTFIFMAMCTYGALTGLRTIAFVSCILLPLVVFLGDFVMSANIPHKDYKFLLPIAEQGFTRIFEGSLYSFSALIELYMLLLIQPHLRAKIRRRGLVLLIAFLALLTVGPVTGTIVEFGPEEGARLRYPAFAQWRLVSIGNYIEHLDFFAIYQWMAGSFVRISMTLYLAAEILFRSRKQRVIGILTLALLIGVLADFTAARQIFYEKLLQHYFLYSGVFILLLSLVLWAIAAANNGSNKRDSKQKGG